MDRNLGRGQGSNLRFFFLASLIILLQITVGCTSRRNAQNTFSGGVNTPPPVGNTFPFGDINPFDTGGGDDTFLDPDDFVLTDPSSQNDPNLDNPFFDLGNTSNTNANLANDCIDSSLFPNAGQFLDPAQLGFDSCVDSSALTVAGYPGQGAMSPLQLLMMQGLYSFSFMQSCFQVAISMAPYVKQDPVNGFVLAQLGIVQCYRDIYRRIAGSRYWAQQTGDRMQSFEPQWIYLLRDILSNGND